MSNAITDAVTWHAARQLLRGVVEGRSEIGLGEACRRMERAAADAGHGCNMPISPRIVSGLLRSIDWQKIGMTGAGYDREPLYRWKGWKP
jgi:hypothetical protein